jgi:hypothetical protein
MSQPIINQSMRRIAKTLSPESAIGTAINEMLEAKAIGPHEGARLPFVEILALRTDDIFEAILKAALALSLAEQSSPPASAVICRSCKEEITAIGADLAAATAAEDRSEG